jgi:beta-aspartyl-peptidase (threonine type)
VESAIVKLEDCPLYDAGVGSVFDAAGQHMLEASIMDGTSLKCGSASGLKHVKNPIKLARAIMSNTPHVMIIGEGAEVVARDNNLDMVENSYFTTEKVKDKWLRARNERDEVKLKQEVKGTVGCVVIDVHGHLVAGTSTGGLNNKMVGRVGDSPLIGAGTYANDQIAVSCTGRGEQFIRHQVAYQLAARVRFAEDSLEHAAQCILEQELIAGDGGLIAVDKHYNIIAPFNTRGMYRGVANSEGEFQVSIYQDR